MKKLVLLFVLVLGGGFSDVLVRPAHADRCDGFRLPGECAALEFSRNAIRETVQAAVSLYEWLDSGLGAMNDYFEEEERRMRYGPGGSGTVSSGDEAGYQVVGSLGPPPAGTQPNSNQGITIKPSDCNPDHPDYPNCN